MKFDIKHGRIKKLSRNAITFLKTSPCSGNKIIIYPSIRLDHFNRNFEEPDIVLSIEHWFLSQETWVHFTVKLKVLFSELKSQLAKLCCSYSRQVVVIL